MSKPSISFWIISVIALLWNLMGVSQYIQQAYNTDSFRAMYTAEQLELMDATPAWSSATFGCLSLLLRKKWAYSLFLVSFIAIIIQNIDGFMRYKVSDFDLFALSMTIMVPLFALFLIWYSKKAIHKNWIS
jgi:hypothetical protein